MLVRTIVCMALATVTLSGSSHAARVPGLTPGPVELRSAGPLAFTDSGVLLVGDPKAAAVYAIDPGDRAAGPAAGLEIKNLAQTIADRLELKADPIRIGDLAVSPETGNVFLSVAAGDAARLVRVTRDGSFAAVDLDKVPHAKRSLPNPPEDKVTGEGRRRIEDAEGD